MLCFVIQTLHSSEPRPFLRQPANQRAASYKHTQVRYHGLTSFISPVVNREKLSCFDTRFLNENMLIVLIVQLGCTTFPLFYIVSNVYLSIIDLEEL